MRKTLLILSLVLGLVGSSFLPIGIITGLGNAGGFSLGLISLFTGLLGIRAYIITRKTHSELYDDFYYDRMYADHYELEPEHFRHNFKLLPRVMTICLLCVILSSIACTSTKNTCNGKAKVSHFVHK